MYSYWRVKLLHSYHFQVLTLFHLHIVYMVHDQQISVNISNNSDRSCPMASKTFDPSTCAYISPRTKLDFPQNPNLSMISFLFQNADDYSNNLALIDAVSGKSLTFSQLRSSVVAFASYLRRSGIKKGDVVLIFAKNSIFYPVTFFSIIYLGAIATTVNPTYTVRELSKQASDCNAKLVLTTTDLVEKAKSLNIPIVLLSDFDKLVLGSGFVELEPCKQTDTAALLYSSGTTGMSKGVIISHGNFISSSLMITADQDENGEPKNTILCFLPMFHAFGLCVLCYAQLRRGNTLVVMESFDMGVMLRSIEKYRVSHLFVVPPVMIGFAKQGNVLNKCDLSSLKWICSGAAPCSGELMEAAAKNLPGVDIVQGYGMTETTSIISLEDPKEENRQYGSAGYLMSGIEGKVISVDTGKPLPPNHNGELLFRGPNMMQGYLNNVEATKQTLDEEGWLHTGDLGYFDVKGRVYVEDRIKELIKCKGFQVAPAELEAILTSHPQILDAAVVPKDDAEAGEVPVAFVVPRNNLLTESDVMKFVSSQVAPYKRLRQVIFESSIPKTASGKILRRELKVRANSQRSKL